MGTLPHVMVVEDEEALSILLKYNLEAEGYTVTISSRGDEAEERLRESQPDLLLLDWMLPGVSGIELCRRLRARPETQSIPIIMLTARGEESERAEAIECAIKTARRYHYSKGNPQRHRILTFAGAFHGRTIATIAAGGQDKYLEGFGPKAGGFDQTPFGDHEAMKAAITDETAAILIEPIQGEGGIREVPKQCLVGLRQLCDEKGILLIFDEVQTGVGRTGKFFAYENSGIAPDILASAKALGGGFPIGACLATEEAASGMVPGVHGSTYAGNPLAMAVGNAVLDIVLEDGFLDAVEQKALRFKQSLASLVDRFPDVFESVRGAGLMIGLKCAVPNMDIVNALYDVGMLSVPAGDNVLRLLPPLNITDEEIATSLERLDSVAETISSKKIKRESVV
ncbi:Acetylornithine aminotransferase [Nymphon striatum]|nr:Acetylornithine aminotransferase [Nymphon striatum]